MAKKKWNGFDPDKRINPDDFVVSESGEVLARAEKFDTKLYEKALKEADINSTVNELAMQSNVKKCWYDNSEKLFHCIMNNGTEWKSKKGDDKWEKVPRVFEVPRKGESKPDDSLLPQIEAQLYAQSLESPWGDLPPTQQKIHEIMGAMKDLLL